METWTQVYNPLGSLWLSALVAALPIVFFFVTLAVFRWEAYLAGLGTIVVTLVIAIAVYGMPVGLAVLATFMGMAYGLWPISWIILSAVFLYKLSVKSGQFEVIRASVVTITEDQRLQVILIGFAFGAFLEGAAGFGAPVAITAAILATLGLNPLYAAGLCLIANTAPVAFGALGIPILVAGKTARNRSVPGGTDGRPPVAAPVDVRPVFHRLAHGRLQGSSPDVARSARGGRQLRGDAVLHLEPHRAGACRTSPRRWYAWRQRPSFSSAGIRSRPMRPAGEWCRRTGRSVSAKRSSYTTGQILKAWSPFIILTVVVVIWTLPASGRCSTRAVLCTARP